MMTERFAAAAAAAAATEGTVAVRHDPGRTKIHQKVYGGRSGYTGRTLPPVY